MWIDLTVPVDAEIARWPGVEKTVVHSTRIGDCTSSEVTMNLHSGSHVDAPLHFLPQGRSVRELDLSALMGKVRVIETKGNLLPSAVLNMGWERVIFKTPNRIYDPVFYENYWFITPVIAKTLVDQNTRLIGVDYVSVEKYESTSAPRSDRGFRTHEILLEGGVVILESLDTSKICDGFYEMIALPMLVNAEASPVRILVRPIDKHTFNSM